MKYILLFAFAIITITSCQKKTENTTSQLRIDINYKVDDVPLFKDTMRYLNNAGDFYSVTRLEYYISDIVLHNANGDDYKSEQIQYVNAFTQATNQLFLDAVPNGTYTSFSCKIGLTAAKNLSNTLPNTSENVNMAWPDMMGGGYHFLKLEGHIATAAGDMGYAMHLGTDVGLVNCSVNKDIVISREIPNYLLTMNINEWYRSPNLYSIYFDGNHTMSSPALMTKIAANGYNIFTIE